MSRSAAAGSRSAPALPLHFTLRMRQPMPHNPDYPKLGSIPVLPSPEALAWVMKEAQFWAKRRGIVATPQTRLADLERELAQPDGYGMLLLGLDFEICDAPPQYPQTLTDVAHLYDAFKRQRDERRAHERRLADGTPPAPHRIASGTRAPDNLLAQLQALEAARPVPAAQPAQRYAQVTKKPSRWSTVKPWHVLALVLGGIGMLMLPAIKDDSAFAYVFPIISATLVAWFVSRVAPIWVPALIVGGFGFLAALNVKDVKETRRAEWKASMAAYALRDVCDGKPSNQPTKGNAKLRELTKTQGTTYWADHSGSWPKNLVPKYTLCTTYKDEEVQCGTFTEVGRSSAGPTRLCTRRINANVELRNTQTAEIVFEKTFRGTNPPPLSYSVQLGGRGSSKLTGEPPSYANDIFPAIEPYLK